MFQSSLDAIRSEQIPEGLPKRPTGLVDGSVEERMTRRNSGLAPSMADFDYDVINKERANPSLVGTLDAECINDTNRSDVNERLVEGEEVQVTLMVVAAAAVAALVSLALQRVTREMEGSME
ncbi:hypothetical protein PRIPAC_78619 [Pristionchus pacificus]|uniref:Uncharacterized protein n=1 Tax=Pristionchus pacificus TaxID=54126 RepID=A0A2A6BXX5_PRIPA|nr:hypothetical protein PRIPAC_78619 [Pristionchus pacificus]|eukprot:PDM70719.1 hypothetical protein PRIPAC_44923 [Pristionchus pacificus]